VGLPGLKPGKYKTVFTITHSLMVLMGIPKHSSFSKLIM
jgi:hypothetical protein